jgi:hypothetical protein
MMDDDKYMAWYNDKYMAWYNYKFDDNAVAFAEYLIEEFEDFCLERYINYVNGDDNAEI